MFPLIGEASETVRIELAYAADADLLPASIIAKHLPADSDRRALPYRGFKSEFIFYKELSTSITIRVPGLYFAEYDESEQKGIILN